MKVYVVAFYKRKRIQFLCVDYKKKGKKTQKLKEIGLFLREKTEKLLGIKEFGNDFALWTGYITEEQHEIIHKHWKKITQYKKKKDKQKGDYIININDCFHNHNFINISL